MVLPFACVDAGVCVAVVGVFALGVVVFGVVVLLGVVPM